MTKKVVRILDIVLWICIVCMAISAIATIRTKGWSYPMWNTLVLGWCVCSKAYTRLLKIQDKLIDSWQNSANSWRNIAEKREAISSKWEDMAIKWKGMAIKLAPNIQEAFQDELHDLEVNAAENKRKMN